jgi:alkanesulfonate monooxygenase SsuD/methylene tetrahydromethanopterin reductase-like flavin-dependent oxidoreductase (luciferase family)
VADFGIHGFPERPAGVDRIAHYHSVLDILPADFSTVWISDHMQAGERPMGEAWTTLTYLAATFPRFRFGNMVLSQSYPNPALPVNLEDMATVHRFCDEVLPALRA